MVESLSLLWGCLWNIRENLICNILVEVLIGFCFGGFFVIVLEVFLYKVYNIIRLKLECLLVFFMKLENLKEGGY